MTFLTSVAVRIGSLRANTAVIWLVILSTLLKLVFAAATGLGIDESYTVATSRTLALSVYDHPPMAWWLAHGSASLFGSTVPLVVRLPFIALSAVSIWQMFRLTSLLFGARAGCLAAFILCCAPVLGITSATWVLPDGPLIAMLLSGSLCLAEVLFVPGASPLLWLVAGLFGGLAMLSKYHGIILFAGAGLFVLTSTPHRRWLLSPWPYLGALFAVLIFSPVIVWNIQHGWASIAFQSQRAAATQFRPWMPLVVLAGQSLFLLPWVWLGLMAGAWRAVRNRVSEPRGWFLVCLGLAPVVAFTLISAWSRNAVLFHWAAPGYLLWIPLLAAALTGQNGAPLIGAAALKRFCLGTGTLVVALVLAVSLIARLPWPVSAATQPAFAYPLRDMETWRGVPQALASRGLIGASNVVVGATNWHDAGKLDYALNGAMTVICLSPDARQYGIQAPLQSFAGQDVILIAPAARTTETLQQFAPLFAKFDRREDVMIDHLGQPVVDLAIFYGTGLKP